MVQAKHGLFFHEMHSRGQSAALRLAQSGVEVGILSCMLPPAKLLRSLGVAALTQHSFLALQHRQLYAVCLLQQTMQRQWSGNGHAQKAVQETGGNKAYALQHGTSLAMQIFQHIGTFSVLTCVV